MFNFDVFSFPVPFKRVFRHSSASRKQAENFIVRATINHQITGWGESCPREYVTGETIASCKQFFHENHDSLASVTDLASLRMWVTSHEDAIDQNPCAFCAIELAILDALGKEQAVPIETLIGVAQVPETIEYSAVLGDSPSTVYWLLAQRYRARGFNNIKIKLSGKIKRDRRKLKVWKGNAAKRWTVRVDANNLWTNVDECFGYLQQLPNTFWAVEEPLQPRDSIALASLAAQIDADIILDESCTRLSDLVHYNGKNWIVNLRISKLGGILRAIQMANNAKANGLRTIVGAHVGETSILTRAAIVLVQHLQNSQLATEGAFGTNLLMRDLSQESLQFARDGRLRMRQHQCLTQPGLGLTVQTQLLKH